MYTVLIILLVLIGLLLLRGEKMTAVLCAIVALLIIVWDAKETEKRAPALKSKNSRNAPSKYYQTKKEEPLFDFRKEPEHYEVFGNKITKDQKEYLDYLMKIDRGEIKY